MKGSRWGSREDRTRTAKGKFEVLCKLMREGHDCKVDLWLELGHFQLFPKTQSRLARIMYLVSEFRILMPLSMLYR